MKEPLELTLSLSISSDNDLIKLGYDFIGVCEHEGIELHLFHRPCDHVKVFDLNILTSNPPQQRWVCTRCGDEGCDVIGIVEPNNYAETIERFRKDNVTDV